MTSSGHSSVSAAQAIQAGALIAVAFGVIFGLLDGDIDTLGNWLYALGCGVLGGIVIFALSRVFKS